MLVSLLFTFSFLQRFTIAQNIQCTAAVTEQQRSILHNKFGYVCCLRDKCTVNFMFCDLHTVVWILFSTNCMLHMKKL